MPSRPVVLTLPSRNGVRLTITGGAPGCGYTIEAASSPGQWGTLARMTNTCDGMEFVDTDPRFQRQRFYRVRVSDPPPSASSAQPWATVGQVSSDATLGVRIPQTAFQRQ